MKLAKEYDPQGKRTIGEFARAEIESTMPILPDHAGVLTKPDRIEPGEEEKWLSFVRGETEVLQKGWFCVKQPSPTELSEKLTWKEARRREETFFTTKEPWSFQDVSTKNRFGTARLTNQLSDILSKLISDRYALRRSTCKFLDLLGAVFQASVDSVRDSDSIAKDYR